MTDVGGQRSEVGDQGQMPDAWRQMPNIQKTKSEAIQTALSFELLAFDFLLSPLGVGEGLDEKA